MSTKKKPEQYIIRLSARNFKKIRVVDIKPNRYGVTKISGANEAGKSSVLDAFFTALFPQKKIDESNLRQGQKDGDIYCETNTHSITRKFGDRNSGTWEVEDKLTRQLVKDPDNWLKSLTGNLGFDPLRFMNLKAEAQFEELKNTVKLDADVEDLETRNENDEDAQTPRRIQLTSLKGERAGITIDPELPSAIVDVDALLKERADVSLHNRAVEAQEREREDFRRQSTFRVLERDGTAEHIRKLREELKDEEAKLEALNRQCEKNDAQIAEWEPLPEHKDGAAIDAKISEAASVNNRITTNNYNRERTETLDKQIDELTNKIEVTNDTIRDRKLTIARALETAKFPVPGLSFKTLTEGTNKQRLAKPQKVITFKGIPLENASASEKIRISAAIGMAGEPDLKFMLIRDGSLLDDNGWAILEEMAHEHGFQIVAEVVDTSGTIGVFMEDGEVSAVNEATKPAAPKKAVRKKIAATN